MQNRKRPLATTIQVSRLSFLSAAAMLALLAVLTLSTTAAALSPTEAYLINQGFQVFNTQTFGGNGRTCSTCHLPQSDFTITPAALPTLSAPQHQLVFVSGQ